MNTPAQHTFTVTADQLAEIGGLSVKLVQKRLAAGMTLKEILAPATRGRPATTYRYRGTRMTLRELSAISGLTIRTLDYRINEMGLKPEVAMRRHLDK